MCIQIRNALFVGILLLSCLLPLVEVSVKQETEVHQTMLTLEQLLMMADAVNATEAGARTETATVTWIQVALLVYLAGIVFFAFRNVYSLVRLLMLLNIFFRKIHVHLFYPLYLNTFTISLSPPPSNKSHSF